MNTPESDKQGYPQTVTQALEEIIAGHKELGLPDKFIKTYATGFAFGVTTLANMIAVAYKNNDHERVSKLITEGLLYYSALREWLDGTNTN